MFDFKVIGQAEMTNNFDDYDSILILDPAPLPASIWTALESYINAGGGVAIFLGHNAVRDGVADDSFLTETASRVMGGQLTFPWRRKDRNLFFSPGGNYAHPIFEEFRGADTGIPWNRNPVMLHWGIELDGLAEKFPTQVLLVYGNMQPAIIERQMGDGRVLVVTTPFTEPSYSPDRQNIWNELMVGGATWPNWLLLNEMGHYLVENDSDTLNLYVGAPASLKNEWGVHPDSYRVYTPKTGEVPSDLNVPENRLRYKFTELPGHFRLKGKVDGSVVLRGFSANLKTEDTDLTRIEDGLLDAILGKERYQVAMEKDEIQRQQGTTRRGQEFYPLLVIMMMVILGVEQLMSNRFYQNG